LVGNLVWKADISENILNEKFIYLKNVIWIYIYSGTALARPPTGWHSIGRVSRAGVVASHLHS